MSRTMNLVRGTSAALALGLLPTVYPARARQLPSAASHKIPPVSSPTTVLDLRTQADPKSGAQIAFDPQGRLVVLYRDKRPEGRQNWHLLRITNALGNPPQRDELSFDPLEAPRGVYSQVRTRLLLTDDGKVGYAVFTVETSSGGRGPYRSLANAVSINLGSMTLLSKGKLGEHSYYSQISEEGDLLSADPTGTQRDEYKVTAYRPNLVEQTSVRQEEIEGLKCWLQRNLAFLCAVDGRVNQLASDGAIHRSDVDPEWQIWHSPTVESRGTWGAAFKDVDGNDPHREDRLWKMTKDDQVSMSSDPLAPECKDRWNVGAVSGDGKALLAVCIEGKEFMDAFFHDVLRGVQLVDATNLSVRRRVSGVRGDPEFAVWHGNGETLIAVLEDAERLKLYAIGD